MRTYVTLPHLDAGHIALFELFVVFMEHAHYDAAAIIYVEMTEVLFEFDFFSLIIWPEIDFRAFSREDYLGVASVLAILVAREGDGNDAKKLIENMMTIGQMASWQRVAETAFTGGSVQSHHVSVMRRVAETAFIRFGSTFSHDDTVSFPPPGAFAIDENNPNSLYAQNEWIDNPGSAHSDCIVRVYSGNDPIFERNLRGDTADMLLAALATAGVVGA